jgi:hypothetical protein
MNFSVIFVMNSQVLCPRVSSTSAFLRTETIYRIHGQFSFLMCSSTVMSDLGMVADIPISMVPRQQVFSKYFGFPCQFSFHQLLFSHHHLSSGAGTIGQ